LPLESPPAGLYTLRLTAVLSNGRSLSREAPVELVNALSFQRPEAFLATEARFQGIEEYRLRGWQHMRKGELRAAEAYVSIAVENQPGNVGLRRSLAGIQLQLGEYAEAVAVIGPVARSSNASDIDLLIYSQSLRGSGAAEQAAAVARTILQRSPSAPAYNALAEALVDLGDTAGAIDAYEASLALLAEQPAVREALERLR
jgi:predicted Zn-dependent protease